MVSLRVAIAAHGKELLMSFTGIIHIDSVTDQSDLFRLQVGGFRSEKLVLLAGAEFLGHLVPYATLDRNCFPAELLEFLPELLWELKGGVGLRLWVSVSFYARVHRRIRTTWAVTRHPGLG